MRVGFYSQGYFDPKIGGGYTFENEVIQALCRIPTHHELFLFHPGPDIPFQAQSVSFVSITHPPGMGRFQRYFRKLKFGLSRRIYKWRTQMLQQKPHPPGNSLQEAANDNKIEILWFLTPSFIKTDLPFVATVWDLAHRMMPMFPEVRYSGWSWESREQRFSEMIPKASYVITGTEEGKRQIMNFYGLEKERILVIPFPTPVFALESSKPSKPIAPHVPSPYVYYPAQFWPHKNHIVLLHAVRLLKKRGITVHAVFTGADKGNLRHIQVQADLLGINDLIHFLGFVPREELLMYYQNAVALVFPTFFGPDNIPPLEAFALGCPVIASDIPGASEQLGDAALLVSPTNEHLWAQSIERIMKDPNLRTSLIEGGKRRARQFTADTYVDKIHEVLDQIELYRRSWSNFERYMHP